jgi:hypothetical protein
VREQALHEEVARLRREIAELHARPLFAAHKHLHDALGMLDSPEARAHAIVGAHMAFQRLGEIGYPAGSPPNEATYLLAQAIEGSDKGPLLVENEARMRKALDLITAAMAAHVSEMVEQAQAAAASLRARVSGVPGVDRVGHGTGAMGGYLIAYVTVTLPEGTIPDTWQGFQVKVRRMASEAA